MPDSLVVVVPVPTSCPSYCAKQAKCEGDQCRAKSRHVTSGATISPRARQMEEQTQGNTSAKAQRLGVELPGAMFTKVTECCECQNSSKCQSPTGLRYTENGRLGSTPPRNVLYNGSVLAYLQAVSFPDLLHRLATSD